MKNTTLTEMRRQDMRAYERMICERLSYTSEDIATMIYEQGIIFAEIYFKEVPAMARLIVRDRTYWNWWRNHWHERNVEFLADAEIDGCSLSLQRTMYEALNCGCKLQELLQLDRVVYVSALPFLKRRA